MRLIATMVFFVFCLSGTAAEGNGRLLHLGLTDNGWQVFEYDLSKQVTRQLTFSKGDKSLPRFVEGSDLVAFRDSRGYVYVCSDGEERRWSEKMGMCASFSFAEQGKAVFYTWWAADNRSRHHLWRQGREDDSPALVKRPDVGSFGHLALSPDGKLLVASQIVGVYEERLVLLDLGDKERAEYLTPNSFRAMYPAWSKDGKQILFSGTRDSQNYDLFEVELATRKISPLIVSADDNEFAPVEGNNGEKVYFERKSGNQAEVVVLDRKSGSTTQLELPYPARGPYWHE